MSRSATYRPIQLSAAALAAVKEQSRRDEFRARMIAALRQEVRYSTRQLDRGALLPGAEAARLYLRVEGAKSVAELRSLAVLIGGMSVPVAAMDTPRSAPSLLAAPPTAGPRASAVPLIAKSALPRTDGPASPDDRGAEKAGLTFDLSRLDFELVSIERTAGGLKIELAALEPGRSQLTLASRLVAAGDLRGAAQLIADVQTVVARLDDEIDRALCAAECRAQTIAAVRQTLAAMGFASSTPVISADTTTVLAHAANGRQAEVEVYTAAGQIELASTFTDPATAVSSEHALAGELCEQAVLDQAEFHRGIQGIPGIQPGRICAVARPSRGAATGAANAARSRRGAAQPRSATRQRRAQ
jgi:hypothetical protein